MVFRRSSYSNQASDDDKTLSSCRSDENELKYILMAARKSRIKSDDDGSWIDTKQIRRANYGDNETIQVVYRIVETRIDVRLTLVVKRGRCLRIGDESLSAQHELQHARF